MRRMIATAMLATSIHIGCGAQSPEELCHETSKWAASARDARNMGVSFGSMQQVVNDNYSLNDRRRDFVNAAVRLGWDSEPRHTSASIQKLAYEQCLQSVRSSGSKSGT